MEKIYNLFKFIEYKYPEYKTPLKMVYTFKIINKIPFTKEELHVKKDLFLNFSEIEKLPEGLTVGENLNLIGCASLKSLPKGLEVGRDLYLGRCTSLQSLPEGLIVGRHIILIDTPIAEKYTVEQIRKMCPGIKGEIYL
jgi:hypothetical protein